MTVPARRSLLPGVVAALLDRDAKNVRDATAIARARARERMYRGQVSMTAGEVERDLYPHSSRRRFPNEGAG